jgi:N-acyl-D-aspartate/D-glutamate deacylase
LLATVDEVIHRRVNPPEHGQEGHWLDQQLAGQIGRHPRVPHRDDLVAAHIPETTAAATSPTLPANGSSTWRRLDPAGAIYFQMDEADVRRVLAFPLTMIGSDGLPHDDHPHPRLYGTFPRVIGHYARELGLFSVEAAIHKMTALPAGVFRLKDRGRLAAGAYADLVVFDPARIADRATYEAPRRLSAGIEKVFVNGRLSFEEGSATIARAGRLIGGTAE